MEKDRSLKSWGVSILGIEWSKGLDCKNCGWSWFGNEKKVRAKTVIGFSINPPNESLVGDPNLVTIGAFIVECPVCFSKFWFHTTLVTYEVLERFGLGSEKS